MVVVVVIVPIAGSKDDSDFSISGLDESGERWMGVSLIVVYYFLLRNIVPYHFSCKSVPHLYIRHCKEGLEVETHHLL